jgi:hypothetical protein
MSALGQKRTSRRVEGMSALPPKSGHSLERQGCPLSAKSREMRRNRAFRSPRRHGPVGIGGPQTRTFWLFAG